MAKRNRKGQFVKGGGRATPRRRKSRALARRGTTAPARRSVSVARRRTRTVIVRRGGGGGGGMVGQALSFVGGPRPDDLVASAALGVAVNKRRATVETVVNYAPEFVRGVGAYGVIALAAGVASRYGIARRYTAPLARAASIIAVNKLTTRGAFYDPGQFTSSLSGDDDDVGADDMDVGALDAMAGDDDDVGDDDEL